MTVAIGVLIVLVAFAFVLLPLFRKSQDDQAEVLDPATDRATLYQQILEAELDTRLGKLSESDYLELRSRLLHQAAALILETGIDEHDAGDAALRVEQEIAAARAAMRGQTSMGGANA